MACKISLLPPSWFNLIRPNSQFYGARPRAAYRLRYRKIPTLAAYWADRNADWTGTKSTLKTRDFVFRGRLPSILTLALKPKTVVPGRPERTLGRSVPVWATPALFKEPGRFKLDTIDGHGCQTPSFLRVPCPNSIRPVWKNVSQLRIRSNQASLLVTKMWFSLPGYFCRASLLTVLFVCWKILFCGMFFQVSFSL